MLQMTWVEFGREVLIDEDNNHVVYAYVVSADLERKSWVCRVSYYVTMNRSSVRKVANV